MQHITIRREDYVAGTSQRPEVGVFTQTHVHQRPTPWGQITVGDTVWMKWSGGPIVAKSVVQGFRQLSASSVEQLRETTRGFRLFDLTDYWASLKPRFNAVTVYLEQEEWLDDVIEPVARSYGNSWIVISDGDHSEWLTTGEKTNPVEQTRSRRKGGIPAGLRFRILRRDGFRCNYCGRTPKDDAVQLHVDHILPRVAGGSDEETNLVTACRVCNLGKGKSLLTPTC